eukprot:gene34680-31460_t
MRAPRRALLAWPLLPAARPASGAAVSGAASYDGCGIELQLTVSDVAGVTVELKGQSITGDTEQVAGIIGVVSPTPAIGWFAVAFGGGTASGAAAMAGAYGAPGAANPADEKAKATGFEWVLGSGAKGTQVAPAEASMETNTVSWGKRDVRITRPAGRCSLPAGRRGQQGGPATGAVDFAAVPGPLPVLFACDIEFPPET